MPAAAARPRTTRRLRIPKPKHTAGPHFAAFAEHYCRHTKGKRAGEPVTFEPWQRDIWNEALRLNPDGRRTYQFFVNGRPRKNYKTTECAALSLYMAGPDGEPGPDVACAAGSRDQADMVFGQARQFIESNAELAAMFKPQVKAILLPTRFGIIRRVSSDGGLQMGLNLSAGILDELHVWTSASHRELYSSLVTSSAVREQPFIATITTAGWDLETLLGELYLAALKLPNVEKLGKFEELTIARDRDSGFLMIWYGAPDDADIENPELWQAVNPAEDVSLEFLQRQFNSIHVSEGEFRRLHLNQWTQAEERWLGDDLIRRLRKPTEIHPGAPIYVGVDASFNYDTTAVSWSHPYGDENGRTIDRTHVFSVRRDVPHDTFIPGGEIDFDLVEHFIADTLGRKYRIKELVFDPRFFLDTAQRLERRGIKVAPMQQQSTLMVEAVQQFYRDALDEKIELQAQPEPLSLVDVIGKHLAATAAVKTGDPPMWKLSKIKSSRPIDATVSTVMSHSRAALNTKRSVYSRRGLLTVGEEEVDDDDD